MIHDDSAGKAKYERSFKPVKVPIHNDASYETVLRQCKPIVWPTNKENSEENVHYYLADGSGISVYAGGNFELISPVESCKKEILPWTLQNYFRVSRVAYPSRVRLYVVKGGNNEEKSNSVIVKLTVISSYNILFLGIEYSGSDSCCQEHNTVVTEMEIQSSSSGTM